jgi:hypothetical protein
VADIELSVADMGSQGREDGGGEGGEKAEEGRREGDEKRK